MTYRIWNFTADAIITNFGAIKPGKSIPDLTLTETQLTMLSKKGLSITDNYEFKGSENSGGSGEAGPPGPRGFPGPAAWSLIAPWNSNTTYQTAPPTSLVAFNNNIYICKIDHISSSTFNPAKWDLLIASIPGETGPIGQKGDRGEKGDPQTKLALGLSHVDDTSDADKPVSIAQQAALDSQTTIIIKKLTHIANNTELAAVDKNLGVVIRDGFAIAGDGGRATYIYSSANPSITGGDGGSQIPSNQGGHWKIDWSSVNDEATAELFGGALSISLALEGNLGTLNDAQPAFQKAANTGKPIRIGNGAYRVNRAIRLKTPGQPVRGLGRFYSRLEYLPSFDLSNGSGIFTHENSVFNGTGQEGPIYSDFMIKGYQPEVNPAQTDAQQLATLVQVSCIDARNTIATQFRNLFLTTGIRGIDMRGNCGQNVIDNLKGSNFYADIDIDGTLDTVRISKHHNFPLAVTTNQAALAGRNAVAIRTGRMDDLKVSDSMTIQSKRGFYLYQGVARTLAADGYDSPGGITVASVTNHDFDIVPVGWEVDAGVLGLVGGYYASEKGGIANGGIVNISSPSLINMNSDSFFLNNGGSLIITGCSGTSDNNSDFTFIKQTAGQLIYTNNNYGWNPTVSKNTTTPKIWVTGGTIIATGNLVQYRGPGTQTVDGSFFKIEANNANNITNNTTPGWRNIFPANSTLGTYQNNEGGTTKFPSGLDITGVGVSNQGTSAGLHLTYQSNSGYIQCVNPGVGWNPVEFDAFALQMGNQYSPMVVRMYGTGGLQLKGHFNGALGGLPTLSASAGTATPSTGYNDLHGTVTLSAACTLTITFALGFTNAPDCMVSSKDGPKPTWTTVGGAAGTAKLIITTTQAQSITYMCMGL